MKDWPDKNQREDFEIAGFISAYKELSHGRKFEIVKKGESPDFIVKDIMTGDEFGVELTSTYLSDRSVPDLHRKLQNGLEHIPCDQNEIDQYKERLLNAIKDKLAKAKNYSRNYPLILSIYVNEYCAIHLNTPDKWKSFARDIKSLLDKQSCFAEVVLWNLPDNMVLSIRV